MRLRCLNVKDLTAVDKYSAVNFLLKLYLYYQVISRLYHPTPLCVCVAASLCVCVATPLCVCVSTSLCVCVATSLCVWCSNISVCMCCNIAMCMCNNICVCMCSNICVCMCSKICVCMCSNMWYMTTLHFATKGWAVQKILSSPHCSAALTHWTTGRTVRKCRSGSLYKTMRMWNEILGPSSASPSSVRTFCLSQGCLVSLG